MKGNPYLLHQETTKSQGTAQQSRHAARTYNRATQVGGSSREITSEMAVYCSWLTGSVHTASPYTCTSCADWELMNNRGSGNRWRTEEVGNGERDRSMDPWAKEDEERRTDGLTKRGTVNDTGAWTRERQRSWEPDWWARQVRGPVNGWRTGDRRRFSNWGTTVELGTGEGERSVDPWTKRNTHWWMTKASERRPAKTRGHSRGRDRSR
jgi:hypothetical protein